MLANPATRHPYYWAAFVGAGDGRSVSYQDPRPVADVDLASAASLESAVVPGKVPPTQRGYACEVPGATGSSVPRGWGWGALVGVLAVAGLRRRQGVRPARG